MKINLNKCRVGQKLRSQHGVILIYLGKNPYGSTAEFYPHWVLYPERYGNFSTGTRTNDGFVIQNPCRRLPSDHDIVKILNQFASKKMMKKILTEKKKVVG